MVTEGRRGDVQFRLVKPLTFMNRSGQALSSVKGISDFRTESDLLVVVDDAALELGRVRFRARGSPGGHNGLRSMSQALGSDEYSRLRIGVGLPPDDSDLSEWVLSPMEPEEEDVILALLPELVKGVETWGGEGIEAAMNGFNR